MSISILLFLVEYSIYYIVAACPFRGRKSNYRVILNATNLRFRMSKGQHKGGVVCTVQSVDIQLFSYLHI